MTRSEVRKEAKDMKALRHGVNLDDRVSAHVGIHWNPREFLVRACAAPHPMAALAMVNDDLARAIFRSLTSTPSERRTRRRAMLAKWKQRAGELEEEERRLRQETHPCVRQVIEKAGRVKRPLLAAEMAAEAGYPSPQIFSQQLQGFPVIGIAKRTTRSQTRWSSQM